MFGLGMWEILVILALALIFIGPKKLPEIAQMLGKGLMEFRKASNEFKNSVSFDPVDEKKDNKAPFSLPADSNLNIQDAETVENNSSMEEAGSQKSEDDIAAHLESLDHESSQNSKESLSEDPYKNISDKEDN